MLNLYDASVYAHTGSKHGFHATASYKGIPTGGMMLLMNQILQCLKLKQDYALLMDSRTDRKLILETYKGSRVPDPKVNFTTAMMYEYLSKLIPNIYKEPGFEADDLAFTVINNEYKNISGGIAMHTSDYDWCHNIDPHGLVDLIPATENVCMVTRENFSQLMSKPDLIVPFNAITPYKVLFGDDDLSRDKIFKTGICTTEELYNAFLSFGEQQGVSGSGLRNKKLMLDFWELFSESMTKEESEMLKRRIEVFYPRTAQDIAPVDYSFVDMRELAPVLSLFGLERLCNRYKVTFYKEMGQEQDMLKQRYMEEFQTNKIRENLSKMDMSNTFNTGGF